MAFEQFPYSNFHDLNLDWILSKVKEWAVQWEELKAVYEQFDHDLSDIYTEINTLKGYINNINSNIDIINNQLELVDMRITDLQAALNAYIDSSTLLIQDLQDRVATIEEYAVYEMFSPFTGELVPIPEIITQLSYFHLQDALTAAEYDALEMTAAAYDAKDLTAIQYDSSARTLLP